VSRSDPIQPYDPAARRNTPLAEKLKSRIRREGPLRVDQYIEACLFDSTHGYYTGKTVLGARGDFITAPGISQIFGELIGVWCLATWQQLGEPSAFNLVEFGPGQGTLMLDALRAMRLRPKCLEAARVILLETSTPLREAQQQLLGGLSVRVSWPGKLINAQDANLPAIVIGNEFLDTQPIEQFVRWDGGWAWRMVDLNASGNLCFATRAGCPGDITHALDKRFPDARKNDICEVQSLDHDLITALSQVPSEVCALFIDYGHPASAPGDTLQAIRAHAFEHPLTAPGEADLTAHVDFAQIVELLECAGLAVDGPLTQSEFLGRLGIIERASSLMGANPAKAAEIEAGVARLIAPGGMGSRFKVIGVRSPRLQPLPGF